MEDFQDVRTENYKVVCWSQQPGRLVPAPEGCQKHRPQLYPEWRTARNNVLLSARLSGHNLTKKGIKPLSLSLLMASLSLSPLSDKLSSLSMYLSLTRPISPAFSTLEWAWRESLIRYKELEGLKYFQFETHFSLVT